MTQSDLPTAENDSRPLVTALLPAYNEELTLPGLLRQIIAVMQDAGIRYQLLVVDDCSSDRTACVAKEAGAEVVCHPYNKGNGAAVKTGIRHARGDITVLMDADGQHNPADIPRLLAQIDRFDLVVGARDTDSVQAWHRRLANATYNAFGSYVTGVRIADLTSGFRAVRTDLARRFLYLLPNTFSYPTTMTIAFIKAGFSVGFVPITVLPRAAGSSKIRIFSDGTRFFTILFKIATLFSPLKIFLPLSLLLCLTGLTYTAYTLIFFTDFRNASVVLLVSAMLVFVLGLISEQIAQLRFEHTER